MRYVLYVFLWLGICAWLHGEELPPMLPLWADTPTEIHYEQQQVRSPAAAAGSPSGSNRVFSQVSIPKYAIHRPSKPNGIGLVICPGGGYQDVWLDREGHDLAIVLKRHGITSLVLNYRTNTGKERPYSWEHYLPAVTEDARQAIRTLRTQADQLKLVRIGVCGFSAGGNLAILSALGPSQPEQVSGQPDFAGLFYPWIREDYASAIAHRASNGGLCPMFIMNAADDLVTPADKCVDFYSKLVKSGAKVELHIYNQGGHGFDLGAGRGESTAMWHESFLAWLNDTQ